MKELNIQIDVPCPSVAGMVTKVLAVDLVAVGVEAVVKPRVIPESGSPPHGSLPALAHMVVFVNCGIVPEQDKFVGMATVTKGHAGVCSQILADGGKPAFGAFPGRKIAIELISSEGTIASCKEKVGFTKLTLEPGFGGCRATSVIPVRAETARNISAAGELLGPSIGQVRSEDPLLIEAEVPEADSPPDLGRSGSSGKEVHSSTHGIGTVQR